MPDSGRNSIPSSVGVLTSTTLGPPRARRVAGESMLETGALARDACITCVRSLGGGPSGACPIQASLRANALIRLEGRMPDRLLAYEAEVKRLIEKRGGRSHMRMRSGPNRAPALRGAS